MATAVPKMLPKPARCVILETMSQSSKRCLEVKTMVPGVAIRTTDTRIFSSSQN